MSDHEKSNSTNESSLDAIKKRLKKTIDEADMYWENEPQTVGDPNRIFEDDDEEKED